MHGAGDAGLPGHVRAACLGHPECTPPSLGMAPAPLQQWLHFQGTILDPGFPTRRKWLWRLVMWLRGRDVGWKLVAVCSDKDPGHAAGTQPFVLQHAQRCICKVWRAVSPGGHDTHF